MVGVIIVDVEVPSLAASQIVGGTLATTNYGH
jgi:hypothetical protein